jgi:hypothetical protein
MDFVRALRCSSNDLIINSLWFEVLIAVAMLIVVFWVATPCSLACG